jgi:hypothetical protein
MWLRQSKILFFLIIAGLVILAVPQLLYPLWFDQGAFTACADVLLLGGNMYRDCWEVRGPITPMLYTIPRSISNSPMAVHVFDLLWQALTAYVIFRLTQQFFGAKSANIAAMLYWLMYASLNYWAVMQAEGFANLFFVLALWLVNQSNITKYPARLYFYSGICCGILFWVKYPFIIMAGMAILAAHQPRKAFLPVLVGVLSAVIIVMLMLYLGGAWGDWFLHIKYDIATFHAVPLSQRWEWLTGLFLVEIKAFVSNGNTPTAGWKETVIQNEILGRGFPFIFGMMGVSLIKGLADKRNRRFTLILLGYVSLAVLLNIWQGHSYRYHFVIWLPAIAMLASCIFGVRQAQYARSLAALLFLFVVVGITATIAPWVNDAYSNLVVQKKPISQIHAESYLSDYENLATYIRSNTASTDNIFIYSDVPAIYALSFRRNATRFPYMRWVEEAGDIELRDQYTRLLLDDITRRQPLFFIISKDGYPWENAQFIALWKSQSEINAWVEANYHYVGENGPFLIFKQMGK